MASTPSPQPRENAFNEQKMVLVYPVQRELGTPGKTPAGIITMTDLASSPFSEE